VRAFLLALMLALVALAPGCGGDDEEATANGCENVEQPAPRDPAGTVEPPTEDLDPDTTYSLELETSCGSFTIELDTEAAPKTSASLVALANDGYFEDTVFHRIVPGFVIQGGDPTQSGGGGPGYSTVDVPPRDASYTKGTVAMAKSPTEPPGTAGSQFFVVTGDDAGLPPEYALVGEVTEGLDVVERIGALGDENEQPTQPVVIETVTVSES
jgi:peptidyl-prolyl cis-trans isomerase B (cyclophilin B)